MAATASAGMLVDTTEQGSHSRVMARDLAPPFLQTHRIWSYDLKRPLLGLEHMFALGYPRNLSRRHISDSQLRSIAGNGMCIKFLCALHAVSLLVLDYEADPTPCRQLAHRDQRKATIMLCSVCGRTGGGVGAMTNTLTHRHGASWQRCACTVHEPGHPFVHATAEAHACVCGVHVHARAVVRPCPCA